MINNCLDFENLLKKMTFSKMDFKRGLGIVEDRFDVLFSCGDEKIVFEIETNFRIRNKEDILLSFNDLYLDCNRNTISVRKYRSQTNIEKTYLYKQIEFINDRLKNAKPKKVITKPFGDIYIQFTRGAIVFEILNDTHLENASLYRIIYRNEGMTDAYEFSVVNNQLEVNKIDFNYSLFC